MKFYKLQVKSATVNIDLTNDKEAPLYLKERQIWGQRETTTRSVDTKEKVHKSMQVSEISASRS